jgi:hypothetical protein
MLLVVMAVLVVALEKALLAEELGHQGKVTTVVVLQTHLPTVVAVAVALGLLVRMVALTERVTQAMVATDFNLQLQEALLIMLAVAVVLLT